MKGSGRRKIRLDWAKCPGRSGVVGGSAGANESSVSCPLPTMLVPASTCSSLLFPLLLLPRLPRSVTTTISPSMSARIASPSYTPFCLLFPLYFIHFHPPSPPKLDHYK